MARTQLFQTTGVEEQWETVVAPWLREEAARAWRDPRPTVVLTPSRAESFYLRSRLVDEGRSFLGLRFWTPSDARTFLLGEIPLGVRLAAEAELRLLARTAAEKLAKHSTEPSLGSVARDPGLFLRAYDLLLGAGWEPAKDGAAYGRKLAREMTRALKERELTSQAGAHALLRRHVVKRKNVFLARLLVAGFNGTHWPLWDLLRAVVRASEAATLALLSPRGFAGEVDQLWIGSWEEETASQAEIRTAEKTKAEPFAAWVESYERGVPGDGKADDFTFVATTDLAGQVQGVVLRALAYLKDDSCRRLGIAFPEENALALGVAEELRRLGVPLDDGTGYLQPGPMERRSWAAWLKLQEEPSVQRVIAWVRACEAEDVGSRSALSARDLAEVLDEALGETLVDNLSFLTLHLERNETGGRRQKAAEFLRGRGQLPESGTFAEFFTALRQAMEGLGWTFHLTTQGAGMMDAPEDISRRTFLAWLKESAKTQERVRGAEGNHFYGRVHLLIYAQIPGHTWSHLILTGLNEGRWPRLSEAGAFGSRHELMELNREARSLNRRSTREGSQGAGHEAVGADRGYCLLPLERQDLALRDLCAAVESTRESVCFAAMTAEGGRALLPSDFFVHAFQAKTGHVLDEETFAACAKTTAEWCAKQAELLASPKKEQPPAEVETTRIAYAARRDPSQGFGRYEFAFDPPPAEPIQLACKTWETAWNHPASIWLEKIVGVSAWPDGQLVWPRAVGTWVHRWMTAALNECRERDEVKDFPALLRAAADREPPRLRAWAEEAGVTLYPWWNHVWGQARAIALGLGDALAPMLPERIFLSEYKLPARHFVALPGTEGADFQLRGKIDLLLIEVAPCDPATGNFSGTNCWVIDFKTGAAKNLSPAKIEKGIGLQAMLYALAVRAAGAEAVAVSLQTYDAALKPQVQIEHIEANLTLFRGLDRMHRSGIFGLRPDAENDYGFSPAYPMASRPIPPGVLETKWALTHGAAALWEEA